MLSFSSLAHRCRGHHLSQLLQKQVPEDNYQYQISNVNIKPNLHTLSPVIVSSIL